ncbi:MAG TPA: hypothetical protein VJ464_27940 [Blastocatellia bacterium]|nr:hypothetical protein [Blastocatellia bacterium]
MSNILMVPIHVDALFLSLDQPVVEAMADFSRLPYSDGTREWNPDIAYISEDIVSKPFQNDNLLLKAGLHLHWALPDALTKGAQTADGTSFPAVPNRWLVMRSNLDESGQRTVDKQWIVESDYLYPESAGDETAGVSIGNLTNLTNGAPPRPFRYLGRKMSLTAWPAGSAQADFVLTAVGYGEPAFAAFYPNCHSVFGLYDDAYSDALPPGLQYDVVGWYADEGRDYLETFIREVTGDYQEQGQAPPGDDDLQTALEEQAQWTYETSGNQTFPARMLCYTRLTFNPNPESIDNPDKADPNTRITVANTGTEALSAYLADRIVRSQMPDPSTVGIDREKKSEVEDQLEAVQFSDWLDTHQLDIGAKFVEARHEKGFTATGDDTLWTVTQESQDTEADAARGDAQAQITLPQDMAHQLNTLNQRQKTYDRARQEIESLRQQLFADWYKYMLCAYPPEDSQDDYPDIDEVKHFIEVKSIAPLQSKLAATGALSLATENGQIIASIADSSGDSLAAQLKQAIDALQQAVTAHNGIPEVQAAHMTYKLKPVAGARYWQPNEPVVLLTGQAVKPTPRYGRDGSPQDDGLLECALLVGQEIEDLLPYHGERVAAAMDSLAAAANEEKVGFKLWTQQPWNPFLLEWEAELLPTEIGNNLDPETGSYAHSFIKDNFTLAVNDVDLSVTPGKGAVAKAANVYTGSSLLTAHASELLTEDLGNYLQQQLLGEYYEQQQVPPAEQTENYFNENTATILDWYKQTHCSQDSDTSTCHLIQAYEMLTDPSFYSLSQSLGGFNEALLMHKQTLQLAIADPLGFDDYQAFAASVSDAVAGSIKSAPEPLNDFNPIRSGALKLTRLRLVDSFGQIKELDCTSVITTEKMTLPQNPYLMILPPRLAQPARLNLRWLSAAQDEQEMNDHPATTPICGWVLPNNLDSSLMIYDGDGKALGSINRNAQWEPTPASPSPAQPSDISNSHLNKMVMTLIRLGAAFLGHFISAIDNALEKIEPENYAQHQDLALLIGRPLALVRAALNLELQGLPAVHQGWEAFRQDLQRINRETSHFEHVEFPIRIGEYQQFNDGLVGYWKEAGDAYEDDLFYAPQTDLSEDELITTHADETGEYDPMIIYRTLKSETQVLAMLVDPRGEAHATCGVLPCKSSRIPPDQYTDALAAIEVTFLSAPILTPSGEISLPLPPEPGYRWSWLQKADGDWSETSSTGVVEKQTFLSAFTNGEDVWNRLKQEDKRWIEEIDATKASVTAKDQRQSADLGEDMKDELPAIEIILSRAYIGQVELQATFSGTPVVREGWLKLSEAEDAPASPS